MELCYEGALVMPSSYMVMDEDEMSYLEGGGTVRVIASSKTVQKIARAGVSLVGAAIGAAFSGPVLMKVVSGGLTALIFNFILDVCGYTFPSIDTNFSNSLFPNYTLNLNKYV